MNNLIKQIEKEQIKKEIPKFNQGDTIEVKVWVIEGTKKRLQAFEGIVIAIRNRGIHSSFTVRKVSNSEGIERVFQTYSPTINTIKIIRYGLVRRSKLYYLRNLSGKSARIKERLNIKK